MWEWRRIFKISWKDHKKNEEVVRMFGEETTLITTIWRGTSNWMGQIFKGGLLKDIIMGIYEDRRPDGHKMKSKLNDMKRGRRYPEIKTMPINTELWRVTNPGKDLPYGRTILL